MPTARIPAPIYSRIEAACRLRRDSGLERRLNTIAAGSPKVKRCARNWGHSTMAACSPLPAGPRTLAVRMPDTKPNPRIQMFDMNVFTKALLAPLEPRAQIFAAKRGRLTCFHQYL